MAWRDNLRAASFRGVKFNVETAEMTVGRRLARHEYPQRDIPYQEDMGRRARGYQVEAFVLGDPNGDNDYMIGRDALLEALEKEGPGQLIHPYHGTLQVSVLGDSKLTESTREGGMAKFSITFEEAGKQIEPNTSTDTGAKLDSSVNACDASFSKEFSDNFTIADQPDFVVDDALDKAQSCIDLPDVSLGDLSWLRANPASALGALLPENLRESLDNGLTFALGVLALVDGASAWTSLLDFGGNLLSTASTALAATPSRATQLSNQAALGNLVQQAAISRQVAALADSSPATLEETRAVRSQIVEATDLVLFADDVGAETAAAVVQLRTDALAHLAATTVDVPSLVPVTPQAVVPAIVLAHDFYGASWQSEGRDEDLIARNRVKHPGFVPAGAPLQFVSE